MIYLQCLELLLNLWLNYVRVQHQLAYYCVQVGSAKLPVYMGINMILVLLYIVCFPAGKELFGGVFALKDFSTKYILAVPTANMTTDITAEIIITRWIPLFGLTENIICDNGKAFRSKLMQNICKRLQISMNFSSIYNPRANGLVESNNKLFGSLLFGMIKDKVHDWNRYVSFVTAGYNASVQTATK